MPERRKIKRIISLEERQLVLNSNVVKSYPELEKLLLKYDRIYKSDFEDTPDFCGEMQTFILYSFKDVVKEASKEWVAIFNDDEIPSKDKRLWKRCSLCNTRNKLIFYIRNRISSVELNVGSECIKKFPHLYDAQGLSIDKIIRNRNKELDKIERNNRFNAAYPGTEDLIKSWRTEYDSTPVVVPFELHNRVEELIKNANTVYTEYISGKTNESSIPLFGTLIDNYKELSKDIQLHVRRNIDKKYICTLAIKQWLIDNKLKEVLTSIMKDSGFLTRETIRFIYYPPFVNDYLEAFQGKLAKTRFTLERFRDNSLTLKYNGGHGENFFFECTAKAFMYAFGSCIMDDEAYISEDELLSVLALTWSEQNISKMIEKFNTALKRTPYFLKLYFPEDKIEYNDRGRKLYSTGQAKIFCNAQKKLVIANDSNVLSVLDSLFKNHISSWKSVEDKDKFAIGNISKNPYLSSSEPDTDTPVSSAKAEIATSLQTELQKPASTGDAIDNSKISIAEGYYLVSKKTTHCPFDNNLLEPKDFKLAVYKDKHKQSIESFLQTKLLCCKSCNRKYMNQTMLDKFKKKLVIKLKRLPFY